MKGMNGYRMNEKEVQPRVIVDILIMVIITILLGRHLYLSKQRRRMAPGSGGPGCPEPLGSPGHGPVLLPFVDDHLGGLTAAARSSNCRRQPTRQPWRQCHHWTVSLRCDFYLSDQHCHPSRAPAGHPLPLFLASLPRLLCCTTFNFAPG